MGEFAVVIPSLSKSSDSHSSRDSLSSMNSDHWSYEPWYCCKFGYEDTASLEFRLKFKLERAKYFLGKLNPYRKEVRMVSDFEYRPSDDQVDLPKPKSPPPPPPRFTVPVHPVEIYPANYNPATWPKDKPKPEPRIRLVSDSIPIPAKAAPVPPVELTFAPPQKDDTRHLEVKRIIPAELAYEPTEDGFCPWFD